MTLCLVPLWKCFGCLSYKKAEEFNKSYTISCRPVQHKCKICEKEYRTQNKEKISLRQKKYAQFHRETVNEYVRNWRVKNKNKRQLYLEQNKEKIAKQRHEYYLKNKENILKQNKEWNKNNKEKIQKQKKAYQIQHKSRYLENTRRWRKNNPERERFNRQKYTKFKRETDIDYRLKSLLRGSLNSQIRNNGKGQKFVSAIKLLGCSLNEFKKYIEYQFTKDMSWENRESFELDHITPCCCYDFSDENDQKLCYKYTNYRPINPLKNQQKQSHDKRLGNIVKSLPIENKHLIREYIFQNKLKTDNFGETYTHLNNVNYQTIKKCRLQDTINNY